MTAGLIGMLRSEAGLRGDANAMGTPDNAIAGPFRRLLSISLTVKRHASVGLCGLNGRPAPSAEIA